MKKPRIKFGRNNSGPFWQVVFPATSNQGLAYRLAKYLNRFRSMDGYIARGLMVDDLNLEYAAFLRVHELSEAVTVARQCAALANG